MQSHGLHKGIFISRMLYHSGAINAELSGDTALGQIEPLEAANAAAWCLERAANAEAPFGDAIFRRHISGPINVEGRLTSR